MQDTNSSFAFGRFRMDLTRRILLVDGRPVALHARAFDILEYLVACRDRAVTRDEIMSHVWRGLVVGENNLSVQMATLRRVLAQHGADNLVLTVPHRGYQFIVTAPVTAKVVPAALPIDSVVYSEGAVIRSQDDHSRVLLTWKWRAVCVFVLLMMFAATIVVRRGRLPVPLQASTATKPFDPPPHSIAVLPFSNLSGEASQDYLSDGLSEELIEALGQIREVQVIARTSSFYFKNRPATIKDIALALDVAAVVEGSVRLQGNHLRIEARLTDARTGFELWSHPFDTDLSDVLEVERDIAARVADALKVKFAAADVAGGSIGGTTNANALDAYLRGLQSIRHGTIQNYRRALASFEAAVQADPGFALAHAGKADALILIGNEKATAEPPSGNGRSIALGAAKRGVQLAPDIGATHIALANVLENTLDLRGAWNEAERAEALNHGDATIDLIFSFIALSIGHPEIALPAARHAVEVDPLREDSWLNLGRQYRIARDYDGAFRAYQHAQTLAGNETSFIAYERALSYIATGNAQRALEISLGGSDWTHLQCRAIAQHALGRQQDAEQTFATLLKMDGESSSYVYAEILAQWRQPTDALRWLAKAKLTRDSGLSTIAIDPLMDPIRQEPGFKAVTGGIDFPK